MRVSRVPAFHSTIIKGRHRCCSLASVISVSLSTHVLLYASPHLFGWAVRSSPERLLQLYIQHPGSRTCVVFSAPLTIGYLLWPSLVYINVFLTSYIIYFTPMPLSLTHQDRLNVRAAVRRGLDNWTTNTIPLSNITFKSGSETSSRSQDGTEAYRTVTAGSSQASGKRFRRIGYG